MGALPAWPGAPPLVGGGGSGLDAVTLRIKATCCLQRQIAAPIQQMRIQRRTLHTCLMAAKPHVRGRQEAARNAGQLAHACMRPAAACQAHAAAGDGLHLNDLHNIMAISIRPRHWCLATGGLVTAAPPPLATQGHACRLRVRACQHPLRSRHHHPLGRPSALCACWRDRWSPRRRHCDMMGRARHHDHPPQHACGRWAQSRVPWQWLQGPHTAGHCCHPWPAGASAAAAVAVACAARAQARCHAALTAPLHAADRARPAP